MSVLTFPSDRTVGTLSWPGSWLPERGPVLATGSVDLPEGAAVELDVHAVSSSALSRGGGWVVSGDGSAIDLRFVLALPGDSITGLTLGRITPDSYAALAHLSPGVRRICLRGPDLDDRILTYVARLSRLTMLQSYGNAFTDDGVQVLSALTSLEHLYLEEESLTAQALGFVELLPNLRQLGLQDVPVTEDELRVLRQRLTGVDVSR